MIRFIALLAMLILAVNCFAAPLNKDQAGITPRYIESAVDMLAIALDMEVPEVYVIDDERCGLACADVDNSIVLGSSFFTLPHFEYELFVLAHEMSHIKMRHNTDRLKDYHKNSKEFEKEADIMAIKAIKQTKYDACFSAKVWLYFIKLEGNQGGNTHPTYKERYEYLVQECRK